MNTNQTLKTQVYNLILFDKSGSMDCVRHETVNGCNETLNKILEAQKEYGNTQNQFVTMAAFCGCGLQFFYDRTPISKTAPILQEQYEPCCMTPLLDSIGTTVFQLKNDTKDIDDATVLVTIITDGKDNLSSKWSSNSLKALIEECKNKGWLFSLIGTNQEIVDFADSIAIPNTYLWKKTHNGTIEMFKTENASRAFYYNKLNELNLSCNDIDIRLIYRRQYSEGYF